MTESRSTVGLIGVGLLGTALAERLLAEGFQVVGFDTDPGKLASIQSDSFVPANAVEDIARRCHRIVLCLPNSQVVYEVIEGKSGLAENAAPETTIVDTTTGEPKYCREVAERLVAKEISYLDATVVGSSEQLRGRDVTLLVGGEGDQFETNKDLFAAWTDRVFHMGPVGAGATAKLLANQVLGLNRLVFAESLALAEKAGVDTLLLLDVLKSSAAYSRIMDRKGPKMIAKDFSPEARLAQHRKDVGLILRMAECCSAEVPLSKLHAQLLDSAISSGWGDLDNSAVVEIFRVSNPEKGRT